MEFDSSGRWEENPDFKTPFYCGHFQNTEKALEVNPEKKPGVVPESSWLSTMTTFRQLLQSNVMPCIPLGLVSTVESGEGMLSGQCMISIYHRSGEIKRMPTTNIVYGIVTDNHNTTYMKLKYRM